MISARPLRWSLVLVVCTVALGSSAAQDSPELVDRAKQFRRLIAEERWDEAREMMSPDPRRWFDERSGEGSAWTIGPRGGPWSGWDEEFGSSSTVIEWRADENSATVRVLEINDYYRLLERGAMTNELTYFFDAAGRIEGFLVRAVGDRPAGRTNEFLQWALENEPRELRDLMPKGNIDPSGDHPQRFRVLLERWRSETGLPDLDRAGAAERSQANDFAPGLEGELRRVSERFMRGWLDGEPEAVMSTLTDGAVLLPHHGAPPLEGADEIRAFWFPADGPAARVTRFEQSYDEVGGSEVFAFLRGRFVLEYEWNGGTYANEGNYMMLFARAADGEWKITHRIWNDPMPTQR